MGAGKSFIGRALATKKNMAFCDMDKLIEEKMQKTVKEIFETEGDRRAHV